MLLVHFKACCTSSNFGEQDCETGMRKFSSNQRGEKRCCEDTMHTSFSKWLCEAISVGYVNYWKACDVGCHF